MIGQKPTHPLRLHHVAFIFPPFDTMCAAGIGRTAQEAPGTGVPAQTACRETYGLLLYAVRSLHPTIRGGRSHLPHGTNRTPRTSQRCDPEGTYADVAQLVRAPRRRYVAGSSPAVCARCRVAPGQCETVRRGSHGNDNAR